MRESKGKWVPERILLELANLNKLAIAGVVPQTIINSKIDEILKTDYSKEEQEDRELDQ